MTKPGLPLSERMALKVVRGAGCWGWTGAENRFGYGVIGTGPASAKPRLAHRVRWELVNGPIPPGLYVLHRCDNPPCTNPAHLFLGTYADNVHDMIDKGRRPRRNAPRGTGSNPRVSVAVAAEILSADGSHAAVGRRFGVSPVTVSRLRRKFLANGSPQPTIKLYAGSVAPVAEAIEAYGATYREAERQQMSKWSETVESLSNGATT